MTAESISYKETGNVTTVKIFFQDNKQRDAILRHKQTIMSQFQATFLTFITIQSTTHQNPSMITILKV